MTDLTAITTPFGLLDPETQKALKEHGGPYQMYLGENGWANVEPGWGFGLTYRVRPEPPKPREVWGIKYEGGSISCLHFAAKDEAAINAPQGASVIRFVEVIE